MRVVCDFDCLIAVVLAHMIIVDMVINNPEKMQEAKAGVTPVFKAMYMCPWEEEGGNSYVNVTFKDASNFSYHVYRGWVLTFEILFLV